MTMRLLPVMLLALAALPASGAERRQVPEIASVDQMRLSGKWAIAQQRSVARLAQSPLDSRDFILADVSLKQDRAFVGYSGDISGRWIGVAAFLGRQYPQPMASLSALLDEIPEYQKADGHFGAVQKLPKIEGDRDMPILWGNGRLLVGLVEAYERTGHRGSLEAAKRLGDYLVATDPIYNKRENIRAIGGDYGHSMPTCYFQCIEGLVALGRVTKDNRYMDEARRIAELAAGVDRFEGFHSHARLTTMRGFLDLHVATGEARWLDAARRDWKTFMDHYRLPIGGVKERLDAQCVLDEGCSEADWLRLNMALGNLTGEGRYWDEAERALRGHFLYQQFANGGAGHRKFHQIAGQPVAFHGILHEAWWCCSEHWPRATVDIARFAVTSGPQGPCVNLAVDCDGTISGPKGKWLVMLRETPDGLRVQLNSRAAENLSQNRAAGLAKSVPEMGSGIGSKDAVARIHRPAWARQGARVETPAGLSVQETEDAWLVKGEWQWAGPIVIHLPTGLRTEPCPGGGAALVRGHDLLVAHRVPQNAWLLDKLPNVRPVVLWAADLPGEDGRVVVPASLATDADPARGEQWKLLELAPLRAVGQPHETAWFSFAPRAATAEQVKALVAKMR